MKENHNLQGEKYKLEQELERLKNRGFFARVPDEINSDIKTWRVRLINNDMTNDNLGDYLFFTTDDNLANRLADNYQIAKVDKYYFIGVI